MRVLVFPVTALAAVLTLTACAPVTRVVMLPQPGHSSVVEVASRTEVPKKKAAAAQGELTTPDDGITLLTEPYQTATVDAKDRISVKQWSAARVKSHYSALLAAQPPAARNYLLYFEFNGTQLTHDSAAELDSVIKQAMARPGNEIVVTGYTDSIGTTEVNDQLSLQRAQVIRQAIVARGFDPARVYAVGRGARDPLVPAGGDQIAEQKNRRVQITVR